jgi:hypothetical protein
MVFYPLVYAKRSLTPPLGILAPFNIVCFRLSSLGRFLIALFIADVPADILDHDGHRWNPDVPLSGRLQFQFHRSVRASPPLCVCLLTWIEIVLPPTWIYEMVVL